jgi:NADPH-dependent glutamate synthase beta subunit-like oxidoreductase/ferredoxin
LQITNETPIKITVDGKEIETTSGTSVLDACLGAGIYIPHICTHPDLRPIGACGLCVVEIDGRECLASSCVSNSEDGMVIHTKSEAIDSARLEALHRKLLGHPADCDSCIKYLNCELQSLKQYIIGDESEFERKLRNFQENSDNPIFIHNPTKCIQCGRCVRACHELRGVGVLYFKKHGEDTYVGIGNGDDDSDSDGSDTRDAAIDFTEQAELFDDLNEEQLPYVSTEPDELLADVDCRFCGACAEVCPTGAILDKHEFGEQKSKRDALIPCASTCPAGIDIPRYIRFTKEKNYAAATAVVRQKVPFPLSLGYVCSKPCEGVCRRGEVHDAVSICDIKRYAVERDDSQLWKDGYSKKADSGKKVAIIGGGPAGLSAAYYLNVLGHKAVVYEAMPEAGGTLRYGIPEYRLPTDILDTEIKTISDTGVEIRTAVKIESATALLGEGYDAVLITIGTGKGTALRLRGAKGDDVLLGTDFLRAAREGNPLPVSSKVLVIGGGNVAFDCARTAIKQNQSSAPEVAMAFLEPLDAMTASDDEIEAGTSEGIKLHPSVTFTRIHRDEDGKLLGVGVQDVASFSFDEDKHLKLEIVEDSEHMIDAGTIIFAVGQKPDIPENFGVDKTEFGFIEVDPVTKQTSEPGIFAAADAVTGTDSVVAAIANARQTALKMDKYLGGRGRLEENFAPDDEPQLEVGKIKNFAQMDKTAPPEEAERCLQCDLRLRMTQVKFWGSY